MSGAGRRSPELPEGGGGAASRGLDSPLDAAELGERALPLALISLTFATGLVDAVSYLGLGRVFTGFQTGNVVLLGFALAGTAGFSIAGPAVSLCSFLAGSLLGGRVAARLRHRQHRWFALALFTEAALVAVAAGLALGLPQHGPTDQRLGVIAVLGVAMGLRNATVRRLAVPDLTTTVLTMTLTGLAADSPLAGGAGRARRTGRRVAAIGAMLLGAVAGALLVRTSVLLPLLIVAGLLALTAAAYMIRVLVQERRAALARP